MLRLIRGRAPVSSPEGAATPPDALALLVEQARAGGDAALRTLIVAVGPGMLRAVRRVLGDANPELEDVYQEATFGLIEALPSFRAGCTFAHFAYRVAALTALAARRRQKVRRRFTVTLPPEEADRLQSQPPDLGQGAFAARTRLLVRELMDTLPEPQAEALVLHVALGLTVEEIAAASGAPVETVRSRIRLAKGALRARLGGSR